MSITDLLLAYSVSALFLTLTPGLDTTLVLRTAMAEGRKKAFQATVGIDVGCYIWGALVAFGLAALLASSELAYNILKWCGALYLYWLGMQLITRPRRVFDTSKIVNSSSTNWFIRGMLGNVLNPKMGVFYISFLPQFISSGHSPVIWTFLLVSIHVAMGTLWCLTLIFATKYTTRLLKKSSFIKWMDRSTGGVFMLFAAKLALSSR